MLEPNSSVIRYSSRNPRSVITLPSLSGSPLDAVAMKQPVSSPSPGVAVGKTVDVGIGVIVGVAVGMGVIVGVDVGSGLAVGVAVGPGVDVGVAVGSIVGVGVGVTAGIGVGVGVAVGVGDGVGVGIGPVCARYTSVAPGLPSSSPAVNGFAVPRYSP